MEVLSHSYRDDSDSKRKKKNLCMSVAQSESDIATCFTNMLHHRVVSLSEQHTVGLTKHVALELVKT